ncbi:adult-specific cuticular protein ACP-22-like isoform X1 [Eriocheir sinensis]|uniref:adult-specific cuticular protein ACP-22-like isoform X1 n=1 Tax=Eriocheir sinensis TaxID=95602 RepID=UPI0021C902FD|nr:adult-specific cuticular protein ACP-22-like isoform X1 [Eriocheir sinensis]
MFCKVVVMLVMALVVVTRADPEPEPEPGYQASYPSKIHPYHYNYHVSDHYGANFGQHEKGDGKSVYGSYHVDLPDGRRQRVDYTADHYGGYVAKVSYYGKAHHPKHYGPPVTFFHKNVHGHGGGGYH